VEAPRHLSPYGVRGRGWKFVVWAMNESRAVEHAFDWLDFVERDFFDPADATVERLGAARRADEIDQLWATLPGEVARDIALAAGRLMRKELALDERWRGGIFAIREGWS
jgi:hypothetical protein